MTHLLGQLKRWRFTEQLVRLAWGGARWGAVVGAVLAAACLTDWAADRYLGSETWRQFLKDTWVFAPAPAPTAEDRWFTEHLRLHYGFRAPAAAVIDDSPKWLRVGMTGGQAALALVLAYYLLVRPWRRTPSVDELAGAAEEAIPEFGHRLVTALQLNRPTARTQGMSQSLIADVTREAGELSARHNLLKLVDYRRLALAALVAGPVLGGWAAYALAKPALAAVLLKRQLLLSVEIPRTIHLQNVSQDVWPTGAEVEIRYKVTGDYPRPWFTERLRAEHGFALAPPADGFSGRLRVEPDGQPEESYDLVYDKEVEGEPGAAYFVAKLPASSLDFSFTARLDNGRTRAPGRVRFEPPPQLSADSDALTAEQWLPKFLGTQPNGAPYVRKSDGGVRGEVTDALPQSQILVEAKFNKPVQKARLIPIVRDGVRERDYPDGPADFHAPRDTGADRKSAVWLFPTTEKTIGYRIELTDDRGFVNSVPIRRNVRMLDDRPPVVTFLPESDRHPDPTDFGGQGDPKVYEWGDRIPLAQGGRVMVIYNTRSEQGIGRANIAYRVIPRGVAPDAYPKEVQDIQHPRQDPENKVFNRLPLKPITADLTKVGKFVPDLGLFEKSWAGLSEPDRDRVNIEFYLWPSPAPDAVPGGLEAGGRYNFEIDGLTKKIPDSTGSFVNAKLEVGDTVELFVEVFDKNPTPGRAPGYTKEARRKIVVTPEDARIATQMRNVEYDRLQNKLRDLAADQGNVFKEPKKELPKQ